MALLVATPRTGWAASVVVPPPHLADSALQEAGLIRTEYALDAFAVSPYEVMPPVTRPVRHAAAPLQPQPDRPWPYSVTGYGVLCILLAGVALFRRSRG